MTLADEQEDIEAELAAELGDEEEPREVVEVFDLPDIFQRADDVDKDSETNKGTTRKIETVLIFRKKTSRDMPYLGWRPIDLISDLDALLELYGPGTYQLIGRGMDRRRNIKVVFQTVGDDDNPTRQAHQMTRAMPAGLDVTKLVTAATAIATPLLAMFEKWREDGDRRRREELERERERHERDRERDDSRTKTMLELVGARNQDLVTAVKALQDGKRDQAGGTAESYKTGMVDAIALVSELKEAGLTSDKEDFDTKVLGIVESLIQGGKKGVEDADHVIANGQAHGGE